MTAHVAGSQGARLCTFTDRGLFVSSEQILARHSHVAKALVRNDGGPTMAQSAICSFLQTSLGHQPVAGLGVEVPVKCIVWADGRLELVLDAWHVGRNDATLLQQKQIGLNLKVSSYSL